MKNLLVILILVFSSGAFADVPVLMYHDINDNPDDRYSTSPFMFEWQMRWLKDAGYRVIPLSEIDNAKPKDIVITFDDGYYSFVDYALPIMKELGFHSTINLVGEWVGGIIPDITNKKALSWTDIVALKQTGLVDFGCHTNALHHYPMGVIDSTPIQLSNDFLTWQRNFKKHTGKLSQTIAWPFGKTNIDAVHAAQGARFKYILTSVNGRYNGDQLHIPRLSIERETDLKVVLGEN